MRFLLLLSLIALPLPVLAQDAAVPPPDAALQVVPSLEDSPLAFAGLLVQLGQTRQWGPLVSLIIFALVFGARKFASRLPAGKVRDALLSTWGGWALNLGVALAGGIATLLLSGGVTVLGLVNTVLAALFAALSAAGLVELRKDATSKGVAAAAAVDSKAAAVSALERGPQP